MKTTVDETSAQELSIDEVNRYVRLGHELRAEALGEAFSVTIRALAAFVGRQAAAFRAGVSRRAVHN